MRAAEDRPRHQVAMILLSVATVLLAATAVSAQGTSPSTPPTATANTPAPKATPATVPAVKAAPVAVKAADPAKPAPAAAAVTTAQPAAVAAPVAAASVAAAEPTKAAEGDVKEELAALRKLVDSQAAALDTLRKRLDEQPAPTADSREQLMKLIQEEVGKHEWKGPEWLTNLKIAGDLRYRYDTSRRDNQERRDLHRVRARLGFFTKVNDEADVVIQFATGTGAITSTNQTLTGSFNEKAAWFDMAYFDYHPQAVKGLNLYGGRMKNPFYTPGGTDLLWSVDVRPEGLAATYKRELNDRFTINAAAGAFNLTERNQAPSEDSALYAGQVYVTMKLPEIDEKSYFIFGAGHHNFSNLEELQVAANLGNTVLNGRAARDFNVWNPFVEFGMPICGRPFAVFADIAKNSAAGGDTSLAWLVGAKYGKCTTPGTWEVCYTYRDYEEDSYFDALPDPNFADGGTEGKGSKISFGYQLAKNMQAVASYFNNDRMTGTNQGAFQKLQLDIIFKF
jgi:hypothetical protein